VRRLRLPFLVLLPAMSIGCFGSSSPPPAPDASLSGDAEGALDGAGNSPIDATGGDGSQRSSDGGETNHPADAQATCVPSTCPSVKVVFVGWIAGADGGPESVQLAVDDGTPDGGPNGTVFKTIALADGGAVNRLVGDFVTTDDAGTPASPLAYANDNNACDVPDFGGRANAYYLAPMQGLPVDPTWLAPQCGCGGSCGAPCPADGGAVGACDYESEYYSQTCPNFGGNCVVTPRKIEAIDVVATNADTTCEVCLYRSTTPSASTIVRCVSPGNALSGADLAALSGDGGTGALLRLDDGTSCASY
jgi:hypothetical protein